MERKSGRMLMVTALSVFCGSASAQMVVHAVSGMVKAINANSKTMDVVVDNGMMSKFNLPTGVKVTLDFDNALRSDSVNASKFEHVGDFVVIYYYGYDDNRTAVAVKDLGAGPYQKVEGTVAAFNKHNRTMTVKDDSGKTETFALDEHLVVDRGISVDSGRGYSAHKGDHVTVTYASAADKNSAVFIRTRE
jgi:hypothetical protein